MAAGERWTNRVAMAARVARDFPRATAREPIKTKRFASIDVTPFLHHSTPIPSHLATESDPICLDLGNKKNREKEKKKMETGKGNAMKEKKINSIDAVDAPSGANPK